MGLLYDLYERKGLTPKEIREGYRKITGLDNDEEMTDEEVYEYMFNALSEKED